MKIPWIKSLNLNKKRIFLRTDLNAPIKNGKILQDFKLKTILPTIDFILQNKGKIILATHIGNPNPRNKADLIEKDLSTKTLLPWFKNQGYKIDFEPDLMLAKLKSHQKPGSILLLENLRFFVGEKELNLKFAELLASLADIYINDAFGTIHRADTSITLLPKQFAKSKRAFGFLIEKEIKNLEKIRLNKSSNLLIALGGVKAKDKIEMLKNFISSKKKKKTKTLLIGGGIALAFSKAQGLDIGSIELTEEAINSAKKIILQAEKNNVEITLPIDQVVKQNSSYKTVTIEKIPSSAKVIDIGKKTIKLFEKKIKEAKIIFANGTMGVYEIPEAQLGTSSILQAIANSNAYKIIGGGDIVAATFLFGLEDKMNFLSTGGGATLKFLGCKNPWQEMPGLQAMI